MNKTIRNSILFTSVLTTLSAQDPLDDFESILNNASDIATKKSINVDYLPSVVTVIDSQTYIDAGVQNVGEALGMLPGVQMQMAPLGNSITTIRGFKNPNSLISDKVKILVDGVAINNEAAGTSGFYMDFPMDLVERIEVLRGPASTVYGAGAIYGAVNIITKAGNSSKIDSVYLGIGSYNTMTSGGNTHVSLGDFELYTDAYYARNEKSLSDEKGVAINNTSLEETDESKKDLSVGIKLINGGFEFLTRYKSSHYGNFYFPQQDIGESKDKGHKDNYFFSKLAYTTDINGFNLETKLTYSHRESDVTAYLDTTTNDFLPDGFYIYDHQVEQNFEAQAIVNLPTIYSNDITIGTGIRQAEVTTNDFYSSLETAIDGNTAIRDNPGDFNSTNEPAFWQDPTSSDIFAKTDRTISYVNVQDLISLSAKTDLILGARLDHYSDLGAHFSSQAGVVYRANDEVVLKLLYGSAYRAPTLTERYAKGHIYYRAGDENIDEETANTYEVALIYKPNFQNRLALNVYYSTLSDVIDLEENPQTAVGYQNMKDRTSRGVELEYFFKTQDRHNLYLNATYTEADYTVAADNNIEEIDQSMPAISKYMLKAMYVYHASDKLSFGTAWQHYSQTTKTELTWVVNAAKDIPVEDYNLVDETITYHISSNSQLRFSIKNLFDQEVRVPSYYDRVEGGYLREGRNFALNYKYSF
ncbi:MAG: TonB-dependent receptor [Campylobacterota bacterium]|nr:TonB-dependent receptor [Campylobacterota bacterium]